MKEFTTSVIVLGAGPAGLGAAAELVKQGRSVVVLDRAPHVGGAAASFRLNDCIVDYGPHAFHVKKPEITEFVLDLASHDCVKVRRKSQLILDGKLLKFPLDLKEAFFRISPILSFQILRDYLVASFRRLMGIGINGPETFESWGIQAFGETLYRLAFGNYSERMWGVPGHQLSANLARQKLLKLNLGKILLNLLGLGEKSFEGGVTAYYDLYPRYGIGTIFDRLVDRLVSKGNQVRLEATIDRVELTPDGRPVVSFLQNGEGHRVSAQHLISTIPLKHFGTYLRSSSSDQVAEIGASLRYRDVRIIYIVLNRATYSDAHWIYLLDKHYRFNRLSEQKNLNLESAPEGRTVLSLDIACDAGDDVWEMSAEQFYRMAMDDLGTLGLGVSDVVDHFSLKLRDVYPVYDYGFEERFETLLLELEKFPHLYSVGRQGLFLNNDIHDSLDLGMESARHVNAGKSSKEWYQFVRKYIRERLEGRVK